MSIIDFAKDFIKVKPTGGIDIEESKKVLGQLTLQARQKTPRSFALREGGRAGKVEWMTVDRKQKTEYRREFDR
jgi:hypothetical protein